MEVAQMAQERERETMEHKVAQAIEKLRCLSMADLRKRYRQTFGKEAGCSNKQFLFRRIAWQLQAAAEGGLSERARRRAAEIANDADLRGQAPENSPPPQDSVVGSQIHRLRPQRDSRLPPPGTLLARRVQGGDVMVKVLDEGFQYQDRHYSSLSAIARQVTGTRWNGFAFFGLIGRRDE